MANRLELVIGDTAKFRIAVFEPDGVTPFDLTPIEDITFTIKRSREDSDAGAVFFGNLIAGVEIVVPAEFGLLDITVDRESARKLREGRLFYWDCKINDADDHTYTPLKGDLLGV
jgi:hypothetical protein